MGNHLMRRTISSLLILFLSWIGMAVWAFAADAPISNAPRVLSVNVVGNRFIETSTVLSYIRVKAGDVLSRKQIGRDVRSLFDTGYFSDVNVEGIRNKQGVKLVFHVVENPVVGAVTYKGNSAIEDKIMNFKLKIQPGRVLSAAIERQEINEIRRMYLKKGYYQVGVKINTTKRADGRVDVHVIIDEGHITHIVRINIVGNHAFSDAELRDQLASQQSSFISYFTDRDVFQKDRVGADAQLLMQYYQNHGYLDSKVESTLVSLSADKKSFYLTFNVYEGPQYRVSKINLQGDMVPSRKALASAVKLKVGDIYSLDKLRDTINAMTEKVGDEGYAFATVTPLFHRDLGANTVAITLDVEKGREVYVERIEVTGNQKTEDHVVRRELRQGEASRYSAKKVNVSKKRLNRLGYFSKVRVSTPRAGADNRVNMNIDVSEKKTGSFSVGVGYSQLEKVVFTAAYQDNNFLGKGYGTHITANVGKITQNYNIGVVDPYFLGSNVSAHISVFKQETNLTQLNSSFLPYDYNNTGATVGFGFPLSQDLTYGISYQISRNDIYNVSSIASTLIKAEEGVNTTGELTQTLTWDTRDNIMAPHEGQYHQLSVGYAGLGGNQRFYSASLTSKGYIPLGKDFTLSPSIQGGFLHGAGGKQVPLWRRFSLGGYGSLRGFDYYGVTIRDPSTNDALGGQQMAEASLDLYFPIPYMRTKGFRGDVFYDAGTVWGSVHATLGGNTLNITEPFSSNRIRSATGFELQWLSPLGPISLVWGFPIRTVQGDVTSSFQFAMGTQF